MKKKKATNKSIYQSDKKTHNTKPATLKRRQNTEEHDALVHKALQPLLEHSSAQDITYATLAHFLNTRTDLLTQRGNKFTRDSVWRILKRVNDSNL